jgi:hypothetical protein
MTDDAVHEVIEELVAEEHRLLGAGEERTLTDDEHARLRDVQVQLDLFWDLLRQRRAERAERAAGREPGDASIRDAGTVEGYMQ